jgi:hypothetical protein
VKCIPAPSDIQTRAAKIRKSKRCCDPEFLGGGYDFTSVRGGRRSGDNFQANAKSSRVAGNQVVNSGRQKNLAIREIDFLMQLKAIGICSLF